jgi:hypothetical protein
MGANVDIRGSSSCLFSKNLLPYLSTPMRVPALVSPGGRVSTGSSPTNRAIGQLRSERGATHQCTICRKGRRESQSPESVRSIINGAGAQHATYVQLVPVFLERRERVLAVSREEIGGLRRRRPSPSSSLSSSTHLDPDPAQVAERPRNGRHCV